jgi:hypothetical protein
VINGTLLGDAWIENTNFKNRTKNCNYGTEHCIEQIEYLTKINEILNPFSLPIRFRNRKNPFFNKTNDKKIINSCIFNTKKCEHFTNLRNIWYPNGIKIVPKEIDLNWRTIAFWYCDDGSNMLGKRCIRRDGIISTNGFTEDDVEFLINELIKKEIKCHMLLQRSQPIIKLHKDTFEYFIQNIKQYINLKCFEHKMKSEAFNN